jgi:hypothetical protein
MFFMKKLAKTFLICFYIFCSLAIVTKQTWAITLSFNPINSSWGVGDLIDIDIVISGLDNDELAVFDMNINYVDTVLLFDEYTLRDGLGDISSYDAEDWSWEDIGSGTINLAELSWLLDLSFQKDSFTLATVSFIGDSLGTSTLTFSDVILGNYLGDPLFVENLECGSANVSAPIPEPATIILLGSGLIGFTGFRKKFTK